ncbi:MAG: transposase [Planctomycetes bacterium]|nr:transposase [Planctomycetota bacterium]
MPQSLAQLYVHLVFSTKNRTPYLQNLDMRERTHSYLGATCLHMGSPPIIVGGVEDHVHILCRLGKGLCVSDLVRELKRESSKWLKDQSSELSNFYWQSGYGAFSVNPGHLESLNVYIATQAEHHKAETYQNEFRRYLGEYKIEYDERYVWD